MELYNSKNNTLREKLFMWKHAENNHNGRMVDYKMEVLQQYIEDPMGRQINEGVWVEHTSVERLLNSVESGDSHTSQGSTPPTIEDPSVQNWPP
jgi:hypothetical protein